MDKNIIYEIVLVILIIIGSAYAGWYSCLDYYGNSPAISSPGDFFSQKDIKVDENTVCASYEKELYLGYIFNGTYSMRPTLSNTANDIFYKPESIDELQIGDIVIVKYEGNLTQHRIIEIKENSIMTQGDNVPLKDGVWIPFEDIKGVTIAIFY